MNMDNDKAFEAFYDELAAVTGTRLETGAAGTRALKLAVRCCVLGGTPVDAPSGSLAPAVTREYAVKILRKDWVDHLPPEPGDVVTVGGFPAMSAAAVLPDLKGWTITCRAKGGA